MFAIGENVEKPYDEAVYAGQEGTIVGNHSYSHIRFSEASYAECVEEIKKMSGCWTGCTAMLESPGVTDPSISIRRQGRGDTHAGALQRFLREHRFSRRRDDRIKFQWYGENGLNQAVDVFWTFDFGGIPDR